MLAREAKDLDTPPAKAGRFSVHRRGQRHASPKALPEPNRRWTPSRGGVAAQALAQAERTRPGCVDAFTHGNDLPWNPAKHHSVGKVQNAYQAILTEGQEIGNPDRPFIPRLNPGAFWPHSCNGRDHLGHEWPGHTTAT